MIPIIEFRGNPLQCSEKEFENLMRRLQTRDNEEIEKKTEQIWVQHIYDVIEEDIGSLNVNKSKLKNIQEVIDCNLLQLKPKITKEARKFVQSKSHSNISQLIAIAISVYKDNFARIHQECKEKQIQSEGFLAYKAEQFIAIDRTTLFETDKKNLLKNIFDKILQRYAHQDTMLTIDQVSGAFLEQVLRMSKNQGYDVKVIPKSVENNI